MEAAAEMLVLAPPDGGGGPPASPDAVRNFVVVARAKKEWEQTVDAIDDPISLQDGFVVRRANRALAVLGEVGLRDVPGRRCHELLAGSPVPCPGCPLAAKGPPGGEARGEVTTHDGRTYEVSVFPLVGSRDGWIARHRDVTLERATAAAFHAQERMAAVGRLAAGAAHEINNPLSFLISNLASLGRDLERLDVLSRAVSRVLDLAEGGAEHGALEALGRFRGSPHLEALRMLAADGPDRISEALLGAQRVAGIVRSLRSLATERIGELAVVDATDALERALRRLHEERGCEPHPVEWGERHPLPVLGQPQGLDEAFYQVLRNALQFSPEGIPVELSGRPREGVAVLRIHDRGPGIPAEAHERIFEPFFTTRAPGEGLGLGLTIAYGIVRQHGGQIRVECPPSGGTVIEISLPLRPAAEGGGDGGEGHGSGA